MWGLRFFFLHRACFFKTGEASLVRACEENYCWVVGGSKIREVIGQVSGTVLFLDNKYSGLAQGLPISYFLRNFGNRDSGIS